MNVSSKANNDKSIFIINTYSSDNRIVQRYIVMAPNREYIFKVEHETTLHVAYALLFLNNKGICANTDRKLAAGQEIVIESRDKQIAFLLTLVDRQ